MSEPDILYPAIFVFSMLLIGLLLTIWEFYRLQKSARTRDLMDRPVSGSLSEATSHRVQKASVF